MERYLRHGNSHLKVPAHILMQHAFLLQELSVLSAYLFIPIANHGGAWYGPFQA